MKKKPDILIWAFKNAPKKYRDLSTNGGDEDWIAVVSKKFDKEHYFPFITDSPSFGCCHILRYETDKEVVYIGCHA